MLDAWVFQACHMQHSLYSLQILLPSICKILVLSHPLPADLLHMHAETICILTEGSLQHILRSPTHSSPTGHSAVWCHIQSHMIQNTPTCSHSWKNPHTTNTCHQTHLCDLNVSKLHSWVSTHSTQSVYNLNTNIPKCTRANSLSQPPVWHVTYSQIW